MQKKKRKNDKSLFCLEAGQQQTYLIFCNKKYHNYCNKHRKQLGKCMKKLKEALLESERVHEYCRQERE